MRRIFKAGAIAVAVVLAGTGVAAASVPDSDGTIRACFHQDSGALRVIDTAKTTSCRGGERTLSWNQAGQPGPQGPSGPQGPAGPQGVPAAPFLVRIGHCVLFLNAGTAAGVHPLTCTFSAPFPRVCLPLEAAVTPASLGEATGKEGVQWYPGIDFFWQLVEDGWGGSCSSDVTAVHVNVRTLRDVPAGTSHVNIGFTYIATVRQ